MGMMGLRHHAQRPMIKLWCAVGNAHGTREMVVSFRAPLSHPGAFSHSVPRATLRPLPEIVNAAMLRHRQGLQERSPNNDQRSKVLHQPPPLGLASLSQGFPLVALSRTKEEIFECI